MREYHIIKVGDLIESGKQQTFDDMVANFSCPLNLDVEKFLKNTAIENQKKHLSRTSLIYAPFERYEVLVGYYSLALQVLALDKQLSKATRQKITGFKDAQKENTPVFLIGQLGKNFYNGYDSLISGEDLFAEAIKDIKEAQKLVGGRLIMVECKDDEHLKKFYGNTLGLMKMECDKANNLLTYARRISKFKIN